jgi:hypothetical protein
MNFENTQITKSYAVSKQQIEDVKKNVIGMVVEEKLSPFTAMAFAKDLSKMAEAIEKPARKIMNDLFESSEKSFEINGYEFQKTEAGVKYDFSNCGDPVLEKLEADAARIKKEIDARKDYLKSLISLERSDTYIDPETGEQFEVFPPAKTSTSTFLMKKK